MTTGLISWAIGVPLLALIASLVALDRTRRDADEIRAAERAAKPRSARH